MKKGNLDKWNDLNRCKNLLFFSQLVNELLFDYSIFAKECEWLSEFSNKKAEMNSEMINKMLIM